MECGEKVYKLWEQLICSPAWHWETTMCTCITCRQIFAEIFCGMLAFGVSTKSWNWENVSFLKWTAWIKGHHQLQDFFSNFISWIKSAFWKQCMLLQCQRISLVGIRKKILVCAFCLKNLKITYLYQSQILTLTRNASQQHHSLTECTGWRVIWA